MKLELELDDMSDARKCHVVSFCVIFEGENFILVALAGNLEQIGTQ